jgi:hypothetical protein
MRQGWTGMSNSGGRRGRTNTTAASQVDQPQPCAR